MTRAALACLAFAALCAPRAPAAMEMELAGDTLFLHGSGIVFEDWARYQELTAGKAFARVVVLNQGGGNVKAALGIAEDLVKRRVATVVLGHCLSACTYIFLAGERRQVGAAWPVSRTRLGFHGVYQHATNTPSPRLSQVALYYRSRVGDEALAFIEQALLQFPDKRGLLNFYHPAHRREAVYCQGSVDHKCERVAGIDSVRLGLLTSTELAEVPLPEKLVARELLFGIELGAYPRLDAAELEKQCPRAGATSCARAMRAFAGRPPDRAVAVSATGVVGAGWRGSHPRRIAWRALYECVRIEQGPCRVAAVNDVLTLDLYRTWAKESDEALLRLKALAGELPADERQEHAELPMLKLRTDHFTGPTPGEIPGVKTLGTRALLELLRGGEGASLIDVWCGETTLPTARCLFGAGFAYIDAERDHAHEKLFLTLLDAILPGRQVPVVFLSVQDSSWLSANAAFRAARGGRNVLWYRAGVNAWKAAGLPLVPTAPVGAVTE